MYLKSDSPYVIFGDFLKKSVNAFYNPKYCAFGTNINSSLEDYSGKTPIEKHFSSPFSALQSILDIQVKEGLYLTVAFSYEFASLFEEINLAKNYSYEIPYYFIFAFEKNMVTNYSLPEFSQVIGTNSLNADYQELPRYSNITRTEYINCINIIKDKIKNGLTYQANFSQSFTLDYSGSDLEFFQTLQGLHPSEFGCLFKITTVNKNYGSIVSHSPELFLEKIGKNIRTRPIKGTRKRGSSSVEDNELRAELSSSKKDISELSMIVDLERNDLGRICEIGSVKVMAHARPLEITNVHHLESEVCGILKPNIDLVKILESTFPCGSITGAPKISTQNILSELESIQRGIYTGALGVIMPNGDFTLNVAIRSGFLTNNLFFFNSGGGIVYDSIPEEEYQETLHKARGLYDAWKMTKAS